MSELSLNIDERKQQLEILISEYIKILNAIVSVHVEIYDVDNISSTKSNPKIKEFVEQNKKIFKVLKEEEDIDNINRMLNKKLSDEKEGDRTFSEESLLNYFNFLEKGAKHVCFIRFSGFDRGVISLFKEIRTPFLKNTLKYSFLKFLMHKIFSELRNGKYNELKKGNKGDYISSKGRDFMRDLLEDISGLSISSSKKLHSNDLFDEFNYISTLNYEGGSVAAKLLMLNKKEMDKHVNFYIKLEEPIDFEQHRRIRKLLETSDKKTFLIGDHEKLYGLGTLRDYEVLKHKPVFIIDFIGKFEYKISMLLIKRDSIVSSKREGIENVQWSLEEQTLLFIRYGIPNLRENKFSSLKLRDKLQKVFLSEEDGIDDEKINSIMEIAKYAVGQRSGTTVVITKPELAKIEIEKLEYQAIRINKTNLLEKNTYELKNIIERITCIDGALYLDVEGNCYAIGVILDGIADKKQGDSSRGARYNSAIRYANKEGLKDNCVIIVISEDGMVDIVPDIEETEEQMNKLINQLIELINNNQLQEALKLIEEMKRINDKSARIYYFEGNIYALDKKFSEAIDMYTKAIEYDNTYISVYNNRAYTYVMLNKYEEAMLDFAKALEISPTSKKIYKNRAYVYIKMNEYQKAMKDIANAIDIDESDSILYKVRGQIRVRLEEYEEAIEDYTKAIELDATDADYYYGRANVYDELNRYEEAIEDYTKAIELDVTDADYYYGRANVYDELNRYEEAIEDYTKAIELESEDAVLYCNRAMSYGELKEYEEAIEDYTKAIELDATDAAYYYRRANVYDELNRYEEAIEDYTKAIELESEGAILYYNRAMSYGELKEYEEAIEDYTKAIELAPDNSISYNARANVYNELNRYEEAIEDYTKAIEMEPEDAILYYNRAMSYGELKEYEEAIEDYTKAIELDATDADYYYRRARLYKTLDRYEEAIEDYMKVLKLNPIYEEAISEKEELLALIP
ncbi:tetratricopeptide repeat protein [Bacillus paramobilis]|uniref:tetratricopeptide repeat protein n=1 Tax=Bacillus paramobilis TaxID=2817477 RepID=UPI0030CA0797